MHLADVRKTGDCCLTEKTFLSSRDVGKGVVAAEASPGVCGVAAAGLATECIFRALCQRPVLSQAGLKRGQTSRSGLEHTAVWV